MKTIYPYRGYISVYPHTPAFYYTQSQTIKGCVIALKRRFPDEWRDYYIWVENNNGEKVMEKKGNDY
jgi:hypothetical protein